MIDALVCILIVVGILGAIYLLDRRLERQQMRVVKRIEWDKRWGPQGDAHGKDD